MKPLSLAVACLVTITGYCQYPAQPSTQLEERNLQLKRRPEPPGAQLASVPRGYALIIGISKYQNLDAAQNLRFPESDAEAIYRVLISSRGGAFPAENVHKLVGPQATLAAIRREIEDWLPAVCRPDDRVVVYFAGHGFVYKGQGFLAPYDADRLDLEHTAYPMRALGTVIADRVKARWKVLLADACHSGKIAAGTTDEQVDAELSRLPGFLTFSATREREKSYEDPELAGGFGLFTYYLAQGWQGAADSDPCDGQITAAELIDYVRLNVKSYARNRGVYQTPSDRGDYDPAMLLGMSSGCSQPVTAQAAAAGGLVIESNMDDVDVYVDDKLAGSVMKAKPLSIPGLASGEHVIRGVHRGYEPDVKHVMVAPGEQRPVSLKIRYAREIKRSALDLYRQGSALLYTRRSGFNPLSLYLPRSQSRSDIDRAAGLFAQALAEDPNYSQAAYSLGVARQLLSDTEGSRKALLRALDADPSYTEARTLYAAIAIEDGDPDEGIRHLTEVLRLEPQSDLAYSMIARAYWEKEAWDRCLDSAEKALRLEPSNEQGHLWKAEALRHIAEQQRANPALRLDSFTRAGESYREYLRLRNISTPVYEWIAFKAIGFHLGSRRHADRKLSYENQRGAGFLGLCICENRIGHPMRAREYCQRAVRYDPKDAVAYFLLGNVYRDLFNESRRREYLVSARENYAKSLSINPELDVSRNARNYVEQIDSVLAALDRRR